jgi:hypothetical protein
MSATVDTHRHWGGTMTMTGAVVLYLAPVLAGVAIGYAGRGPLTALAGRLRARWLPWLAVAVQVSQFYLRGSGRWSRTGSALRC